MREYIWGNLVARLGFDEMFLDVTDMIEHNMKKLPESKVKTEEGFFYLSEDDDSKRFAISWKDFPGYIYPKDYNKSEFLKEGETWDLHTRLFLAGYFASFLRAQVGAFFNHTASAGVSISMITAKLAGAVNKPDKQTILVPSAIQDFMNDYELGKVPGIGFKMAGTLRCAITGQEPSDNFDEEPKVQVTVKQVRDRFDRGQLELLLGPSDAHKCWTWMKGEDDGPLSPAPLYPTQISIEDTFRNPLITTMPSLLENLFRLCHKLIQRLRAELLSGDETRWLAYPKTFRIQTSTKSRSYADGRISRTTAFPHYVFATEGSIDEIADKMVSELAMPLLKKMLAAEGETKGWEIWLLNVAGVNMTTGGSGMDIQDMFRISAAAAADAPKVDAMLSKSEEEAPQAVSAEKSGITPFFKKQTQGLATIPPSTLLKSQATSSAKRPLPSKGSNTKAKGKSGVDIRTMFQRTPS